MDLLKVRYNYAKFHHCSTCLIDFWAVGRDFFPTPYPNPAHPWTASKKPILNRVKGTYRLINTNTFCFLLPLNTLPLTEHWILSPSFCQVYKIQGVLLFTMSSICYFELFRRLVEVRHSGCWLHVYTTILLDYFRLIEVYAEKGDKKVKARHQV